MKSRLRRKIKIGFWWFIFVGAGWLEAKSPKNKEPQEPIEVLPTFVVIGTRIPSSWLEVAWECRGPMPVSPVKRAWISRVQSGSPPDEAGFKAGDSLLAFGGLSVSAMTGVSLQMNLQREREAGTREEFTLQTPGKEPRKVVIVFAKDTKH